VPFLFGAAVVHQRTLRGEFLAPTMQRYGVTHVALVPRILRTLKERIEEQLDALPGWQRQAIDSAAELNHMLTARAPRPLLSRALLRPIQARFGGKLRILFAGGGFVERELADFFYRLGLPIAIGYGLTEACTVLTVNDLSPYRADSVGKPLRGVTLELRDVGEDGVGEVYARSRTLMLGYLDAPELTKEALVDGFLRTGDLGVLDASGHLKLVGRRKNMIVTEGGKNVYPEDVEAALEALACEELCVLSSSTLWPGAGLGSERIVLVVRLKPEQSEVSFVRELRANNARLAEHKRVRSYVLVSEEMPRTASLKVKRAELAREVKSRALVERPLERAPAVRAEGAAP
jgi:long-chain acyl-CoA synthetase